MNEERNPYETATVEPGLIVESGERKSRTWHPVSILLIPIIAANVAFWLIFLFCRNMPGNYGLSGLVYGVYATPVVGLVYGLTLGSYLFFIQRIQNWFYFPLVMGVFRGLWFFGCMTGGCMIIYYQIKI